ncbi:MAG: ankyrin repeat domain-containing protein, partial [bacterium]
MCVDGVAVTAASSDACRPTRCDDDVPLLLAVRVGRLDLVQLLVDAGAAVNVRGAGGASLLAVAARAGSVPVLQYVASIVHRHAVNDVDERGFTALHAACSGGSLAAVQDLVEQLHVDVNSGVAAVAAGDG